MKLTLPLKVVLPLALGIIASIAIAVYAELSYRRLESANRQLTTAVEMHAALLELLGMVVDAETGQRGYLLTGKSEYLTPYNAAIPRIEGALSRLRKRMVQGGTPAQREVLGSVTNLVGKKLAELEAAIALYQKDGPQTAQALLDTGIGKQAMDDIRGAVDSLAASYRQQLDQAANKWASDIALARLSMQVMTTVTVGLLFLLWLLARRDAQRRDELQRAAIADNRRLEALVNERTAELLALSNHLQIAREDEKSKLARELHDELGGILVSAKMDVAWVEGRLRSREPESASKLERVLTILDDGVQIKRRIIEELRPTLLDNLGLSAAMDWQTHDVCGRAELACTITTPGDDSTLPPHLSIALYRILQEALVNIVKYAHARNVNVELSLSEHRATLVIEDDGIGIPDQAQNNLLSHGIAGMRHRARALQGEFSIRRRAEAGTVIEVGVPLPCPAAAPLPDTESAAVPA